jgi:hypothetical protein
MKKTLHHEHTEHLVLSAVPAHTEDDLKPIHTDSAKSTDSFAGEDTNGVHAFQASP